MNTYVAKENVHRMSVPVSAPFLTSQFIIFYNVKPQCFSKTTIPDKKFLCWFLSKAILRIVIYEYKCYNACRYRIRPTSSWSLDSKSAEKQTPTFAAHPHSCSKCCLL